MRKTLTFITILVAVVFNSACAPDPDDEKLTSKQKETILFNLLTKESKFLKLVVADLKNELKDDPSNLILTDLEKASNVLDKKTNIYLAQNYMNDYMLDAEKSFFGPDLDRTDGDGKFKVALKKVLLQDKFKYKETDEESLYKEFLWMTFQSSHRELETKDGKIISYYAYVPDFRAYDNFKVVNPLISINILRMMSVHPDGMARDLLVRYLRSVSDVEKRRGPNIEGFYYDTLTEKTKLATVFLFNRILLFGYNEEAKQTLNELLSVTNAVSNSAYDMGKGLFGLAERIRGKNPLSFGIGSTIYALCDKITETKRPESFSNEEKVIYSDFKVKAQYIKDTWINILGANIVEDLKYNAINRPFLEAASQVLLFSILGGVYSEPVGGIYKEPLPASRLGEIKEINLSEIKPFDASLGGKLGTKADLMVPNMTKQIARVFRQNDAMILGESDDGPIISTREPVYPTNNGPTGTNVLVEKPIAITNNPITTIDTKQGMSLTNILKTQENIPTAMNPKAITNLLSKTSYTTDPINILSEAPSSQIEVAPVAMSAVDIVPKSSLEYDHDAPDIKPTHTITISGQQYYPDTLYKNKWRKKDDIEDVLYVLDAKKDRMTVDDEERSPQRDLVEEFRNIYNEYGAKPIAILKIFEKTKFIPYGGTLGVVGPGNDFYEYVAALLARNDIKVAVSQKEFLAPDLKVLMNITRDQDLDPESIERIEEIFKEIMEYNPDLIANSHIKTPEALLSAIKEQVIVYVADDKNLTPIDKQCDMVLFVYPCATPIKDYIDRNLKKSGVAWIVTEGLDKWTTGYVAIRGDFFGEFTYKFEHLDTDYGLDRFFPNFQIMSPVGVGPHYNSFRGIDHGGSGYFAWKTDNRHIAYPRNMIDQGRELTIDHQTDIHANDHTVNSSLYPNIPEWTHPDELQWEESSGERPGFPSLEENKGKVETSELKIRVPNIQSNTEIIVGHEKYIPALNNPNLFVKDSEKDNPNPTKYKYKGGKMIITGNKFLPGEEPLDALVRRYAVSKENEYVVKALISIYSNNGKLDELIRLRQREFDKLIYDYKLNELKKTDPISALMQRFEIAEQDRPFVKVVFDKYQDVDKLFKMQMPGFKNLINNANPDKKTGVDEKRTEKTINKKKYGKTGKAEKTVEEDAKGKLIRALAKKNKISNKEYSLFVEFYNAEQYPADFDDMTESEIKDLFNKYKQKNPPSLEYLKNKFGIEDKDVEALSTFYSNYDTPWDFYLMGKEKFNELFSEYMSGDAFIAEESVEDHHQEIVFSTVYMDEELKGKLKEYLEEALSQNPLYKGSKTKINEAFERFTTTDGELLLRIIQELCEQLYYEGELSEESEKLLSDVRAFELIRRELNARTIDDMGDKLKEKMKGAGLDLNDPSYDINSTLKTFKDKYGSRFAIKK